MAKKIAATTQDYADVPSSQLFHLGLVGNSNKLFFYENTFYKNTMARFPKKVEEV